MSELVPQNQVLAPTDPRYASVIELRRNRVFDLHLKGYNARAIAEVWNSEFPQYRVSFKTIASDIRVVLDALAEGMKLSALQYRVLSVERLNRVIRVLEPRVDDGELGAIDRYITAVKTQALIMGANAPTKVEVSDEGKGKNPALMSDEERQQRIRELFTQVEDRIIDTEVILDDGTTIYDHPPEV